MSRLFAYLALALILNLPASGAPAGAPPTSVEVWGRHWTVAPVEEQPGLFSATRDNNNLDPFGPPARLRTHQAIRAYARATGCRVNLDSMYQLITGVFFAKLHCKR